MFTKNIYLALVTFYLLSIFFNEIITCCPKTCFQNSEWEKLTTARSITGLKISLRHDININSPVIFELLNSSKMSNELLTTSFFKMVFLAADKDDDCKITLKQLGKLTIVYQICQMRYSRDSI